MKHKSIAIIGLGLIGGSIARALHERLNICDITAVDRDLKGINLAVGEGIISRGFTKINEKVLESDIIFICTPVKYAVKYLAGLSGKTKPGCIVTDVGSTKAEIVEYVNGMSHPPCFIGGHPMAGGEKSGYAASHTHLFENAYYILTPSKSATGEAMKSLKEIIKGIGGIPVLLDANEHDKITGCISHAPHIIASALVNMIKDMDSADGKMQMLAAGGFKDITRIASSDPEMWESITLSNKLRIGQILDNYICILEKFRDSMDRGSSSDIYSFFESSKRFRDSIPSGKAGLITPVYELIVDVVDKPGIIGEIATILGRNGINIKNINVSNSREFEQGCLKITLADASSMDKAFELLEEKGYRTYKQ